MSDETKVPPGWVRLTDASTEHAHVAPWWAWRYQITAAECVMVWLCDIPHATPRHICVEETPAEVAALIAEAQAAERRARALPVMAAVCDLAAAVRREDMPAMAAVMNAAAILDAIERRERE